MNEKTIRIAVVGQPLSGKDVVAKYIEENYDFVHVSTSDLLRDYIRKHNLGEPVRELMHRVGNQVRREGGPGVLIKQAIEIQGDHPRLVLSAVRSKSEIDPFTKDFGGVVIAVSAPIEDRYKRAFDRGRPGDHISFEQFKAEEERESATNDPFEQNVNYMVSKAKYTIENVGTIDELLVKTDKLMEKLGLSKISK